MKTLIAAAILVLSCAAASPSTAPKPQPVKPQAGVIYPAAFWVFMFKGCGYLELTLADNYAIWVYDGKPVCTRE